MLALRRPAAVGEKKLQPHDGSKGLPLLAVDHPGKATKTALETPHVDALVGRPLVFRHDASPVKAHVSRGGDLVGSQVQAEQRYCHFKRSAILRPARRTRVHKPPPNAAKTAAAVGAGWQRYGDFAGTAQRVQSGIHWIVD